MDAAAPSPPGRRRGFPMTHGEKLGCFAVVIPTLLVAIWAVQSLRDALAERVAQPQVRAVLDRQAEAWNRGDLDGFMAGYWNSDELTFYSGGTVTTGWHATLERYRKRYQSDGQEMGTLAFDDLHVETFGPDAAVTRGHWKLTRKKDSPEGLFTLALKRFPDGWKIVHDHTSIADPPKPQ